MTDEERVYSRGLSHAYGDVFDAFTTAFREGHDIHWLYSHISAQWDGVCAMQAARATL